MDKTQQEAEILRVCNKIYEITNNALLLEMRFLDVALSRLPAVAWEGDLCTDGANLYHNPAQTIHDYRNTPNKVAHDTMHILLHCVFRHLFFAKCPMPCWDLACDITVEQLIASLHQGSLDDGNKKRWKQVAHFEKNVQPFTPFNVLGYLQQQQYSKEQLAQLEALFYVDDHSPWYRQMIQQELTGQSRNSALSGAGSDTLSNGSSVAELMAQWADVSRTMEMNLETFQKKQGDQAGSLMQQLRSLNREKYDYGKFLKSFAEIREAMVVNDDEYDYIFYTLGLNMFGNMPLIEPLEYKDVHRIRDFVIAIDTSGSTSGETVQTFLQTTYNILKSSETFLRKVNIYIIQCDASIQEVAHIASDEDFERYIQTMTIKGLGGTDFRPVFEKVDQMIAEKAFHRLKGILYFTDGYGTFPAQKPAYEAAFIFVVEEDYKQVKVPSWAMKVLLTEGEIQEMKQPN